MQNKQLLKLYFIILFLTNFFGLIILKIDKIVYFQVIIIFYYIWRFKSNQSIYSKLILAYLLFIVCSCIYANLYNNQNVIKSFIYSYNYIGIGSFFICQHVKLSYPQTLNLIKKISITFCCCYIIQWLIYPITIFSGSLDDLNISNDIFRMRMPGSISAYYLFFYGVNQFLLNKKKINILYIILGFIPIIIMGFRSLTFLTCLCVFLMVGTVYKKFWKVIFIGTLCGIVLYSASTYIPLINQKIEEMAERQNNNQTFKNKDYVRWIEYEYFTENVFNKTGERFWGGGSPHNQNSTYYKKINRAAEYYHLYWADLGVIGLSFVIGIPAILILSFIILKITWNCKRPSLQYIRFTLLTVFLGSIMTSAELYRPGNLILIGIYIYAICSYKQTLVTYENRNYYLSSSK